MPKSELSQAQAAADRRRGNAGAGAPSDPFALALASMDASTAYMTVSIALLEADGHRYAIYAAQNGADLSQPLQAALNGFELTNATQQMYNRSSPSGLHAEMVIIRYLYAKSVLQRGAEIACAEQLKLRMVCVGKLVCADCSGWLHAHGIPHFKTEADGATPQWVHPRTGALYSGGNTIKYYVKGSTILGELSNRRAGSLRPVNAMNIDC